MSNARTGTARRQGRDDGLLKMRRLLHSEMWAKGFSRVEIMDACAKLHERHGQPGISEVTYWRDRKAIQEDLARRMVDSGKENINALDRVIREAWTAFFAARESSMNRSGLLNVIVRAVETRAKIDGSFLQQQLEQAAASIRDLVLLGLEAAPPGDPALVVIDALPLITAGKKPKGKAKDNGDGP